MVTRGNNAPGDNPVNPGSIKTFAFKGGVLSGDVTAKLDESTIKADTASVAASNGYWTLARFVGTQMNGLLPTWLQP